ncbi:rhodoquinone biosynthesis methyltransferase RquA [Novispirillum itersonii]|uniref:SAM-dependent methyltransferase n=1 Tax=Novispirillum itersonii TaxID=189 RepID=A0A7X0DMQ6_NOVIT|nr:rhodoquinone biosynthesis methyltransferase RquA [Novispirillum itersonii]MBB6210529.1 SAM-dependent methyltransferase [Novispirillum itersonii]
MPDGTNPRPARHPQPSLPGHDAGDVPAYLAETYTWAYLSGFGTRFFDYQAVVNTILWGNADRLMDWVARDITPGSTVWQPAAVYGGFSRRLADRTGPLGRLIVSDVAPVQVDLTTRKLTGIPQARVIRHDARESLLSPDTAEPMQADTVTCFFLLHEVPAEAKRQVTAAVLRSVSPAGKAVFVDYHAPALWHPLRPVMMLVFALLEPFARELWTTEIQQIAADSDADDSAFSWHKETLFGGMYQKVTATRIR